MSNISTLTHNSTEPTLVTVSNNRVITKSTDVAKQFHKQHTKVIRSINSLIAETGEWGIANFGDTLITNEQNGEQYQIYEITRDGFTLLAMGFTGKKALQFKLGYIEAFNMMEAELLRISAESRTPYTVNPNDTLTAAQAEQLRVALKNKCDALPKDKQAAFMTKGWSKLKTHFGCTYRQIPQREFSEALSLVTRHVTEWELLDAPAEPAKPVLSKELREKIDRRAWELIQGEHDQFHHAMTDAAIASPETFSVYGWLPDTRRECVLLALKKTYDEIENIRQTLARLASVTAHEHKEFTHTFGMARP